MNARRRAPWASCWLVLAFGSVFFVPSLALAEIPGVPLMPVMDAPAGDTAKPVSTMPEPSKLGAPVPAPALNDKVAPFVDALWPEAQKRRISRELFDRALRGIEADPEIFDLLANQPESVVAPWDYLQRLVSDARIEAGREKLAAHANLLAHIESRLGVDKHIVLAIWGIESSFGTAMGSRHVIRSLTTLAIGDPRRPQFWRGELLAALGILEKNDISLDRMLGSWAGAMGHTQFMPSSYTAHAVDFDGDGRRDIWGSVPDALASTANYLRTHGWRVGEPWGIEVVVPAGFDHALTRPSVVKTTAEWQALGVAALGGRPLPEGPARFSLLLPAGANGPALLTGGNFQAILKYNNAVSYALAVGHLADRIAGGPPLAASWPVNDPPLERTGREDLQRQLQRVGLDPGPLDGVIGSATRRAVREYQVKHGLTEDGWAGRLLLERLKSDVSR